MSRAKAEGGDFKLDPAQLARVLGWMHASMLQPTRAFSGFG